MGKTANISLTPSTRLGNGILTASAPFFSASMIGELFQLTHTQTTCDVSVAGPDQYSDSVRVAGKNEGTSRNVSYDINGTWASAVSVQISYDEEITWQTQTTYLTDPNPITFSPGTDNTIVFVRIGFQSYDYVSGTALIIMSSQSGGGSGVVRITGYTDSTHATYEVVSRLHFTGITENWQEGKYSDLRGWPSSVVLHEGRLWWGGADQLAGSGSDDYTNFNVDDEGDGAPIIRSIATGPVNKVQWMLGLSRLIVGTSGAESVPRSSSFDEPMTPTNFSIKDASTYGSADIQAVKLDRSGIFTQRSLKRAYVLGWSVDNQDYSSSELTRYNPTILNAGVVVMAVQRQPDNRIWFVLADGTAACLIYEPSEDVIAWVEFETDGIIEDIMVLPNLESDDVFMVVKRTINNVTKRYRERLSYDTNAVGGTDNYMSDSYVIKDIVASATITGLSHLEGKQVVVWASGAPILDANYDPTRFTVAAGQITLSAAMTGRAIVGLYYEGQWKSTKLAYAAQAGTAMSQKKIIQEVSPILYKTHNRALKFGSTFTNTMDFLPRKIKGVDVGENAMLSDHDYDGFALPGTWDNDARLCITMRAPMPATILGLGILMEAHERG